MSGRRWICNIVGVLRRGVGRWCLSLICWARCKEGLDASSANEKQREEYVRRRARELAESGRFSGWLGIEFELRYVEGFQEARVWSEEVPIREELKTFPNIPYKPWGMGMTQIIPPNLR
jgi:hypothetical protein